MGTVGRMGKLLLAAGAAAVVLTLTGCIQSTPQPTAPPTPSATPVFASDEEALAAAEAAYAAYLEVSDAISADGGKDVARLMDHVTDAEFARSVEQFQAFEATGNHTEGTTAFDSTTLQRFDDREVTVYLCLDVTAVRIVDGQGTDVTPADRPGRLPLEVTLQIDESTHLALSASDVWDRADYCVP